MASLIRVSLANACAERASTGRPLNVCSRFMLSDWALTKLKDTLRQMKPPFAGRQRRPSFLAGPNDQPRIHTDDANLKSPSESTLYYLSMIRVYPRKSAADPFESGDRKSTRLNS